MARPRNPVEMHGLTEFQRSIVQGAALGETYKETAHRLGTTRISVSHSGGVAMRKLGASTIAHAVHLASLARLISRYPCGDYRTYCWHLRTGIPLDDACHAARRRYENDHPRPGRRKGP